MTGGERIFAAGADISEFGGPERVASSGHVARRSRRVATIPRLSSPPSPDTPWAAGPSSRWLATTGWRRSGRCSASPRSCSASSPAAAARNGCPAGRPGRAKDIILTGRQVKAEALRIGLADEIVAPEEVNARALALAAELAPGPLQPRRLRRGRSTAASTADRRPGARADLRRRVPHRGHPDRREELPRAGPRQGPVHRTLRGRWDVVRRRKGSTIYFEDTGGERCGGDLRARVPDGSRDVEPQVAELAGEFR